VIEQGERWARAYLSDPSAVDPDMIETALELAALQGDLGLFDSYRQRFESTPIPAERRRMLTAMGAFRSPPVVERALQYSLEGPLRPQEILVVANGIFKNPRYEDHAYRWATENYDKISGRVPPSYLSNLAEFADGCSEERFASAREFFADPSHHPKGIKEEFAKVTDRVEDCLALRAREGARAQRYLAQAARGASTRPLGASERD
jgi:hypothetical protein